MNGDGSRQGTRGGEGGIHTLLGGTQGGVSSGGLGGVVNPELGGTEEAIIEKTLLSIQEKVNMNSIKVYCKRIYRDCM